MYSDDRAGEVLDRTKDELDETAVGRYENKGGSTHIFLRGNDRNNDTMIIHTDGDRREARPVLCLMCGAEIP